MLATTQGANKKMAENENGANKQNMIEFFLTRNMAKTELRPSNKKLEKTRKNKFRQTKAKAKTRSRLLLEK